MRAERSKGTVGSRGVDADETFTSDYAPEAFPLSINYKQRRLMRGRKKESACSEPLPLGGLGGVWHLSQLCPQASLLGAILPREPAGPSACLLLICLGMGLGEPGEREGNRCMEHGVAS